MRRFDVDGRDGIDRTNGFLLRCGLAGGLSGLILWALGLAS